MDRDLTISQNRLMRARLKAYLVEQKLTQKELAPKMGIDQSQLSKILKGKSGVSFMAARRFAMLIGMTIEELLTPPESDVSNPSEAPRPKLVQPTGSGHFIRHLVVPAGVHFEEIAKRQAESGTDVNALAKLLRMMWLDGAVTQWTAALMEPRCVKSI